MTCDVMKLLPLKFNGCLSNKRMCFSATLWTGVRRREKRNNMEEITCASISRYDDIATTRGEHSVS